MISLKIDEDTINNEIETITIYKKEIEKFKDSYIFVNTNFKRKNEPIFTLTLCENQRRISQYKKENLLFKTINEILEIASKDIKEHYSQNTDSLGIFFWKLFLIKSIYLILFIYYLDTNEKLKLNNVKYSHHY